MLAKIQDIQQFETAVQWMQAGQSALQVGMVLTLILLGLSVASVILKDERLTHAARRGQYAMLALTAFCSGLLYLGIFDGYYFVNYVSHVTENNELLQFKISALWASQSGSLLFWCLILTSFSSAFAFSQRHNRTDRRLPYTLAVLAVVQFFFFFILVSPTSAEAAQRSSPFSLSYYWMSAPEAASTTMQAALQGGTLKAPAEGWAIVRAFIEAGHGDWTLGHAYTVITTDAASLPKPVQMALLDGGEATALALLGEETRGDGGRRRTRAGLLRRRQRPRPEPAAGQLLDRDSPAHAVLRICRLYDSVRLRRRLAAERRSQRRLVEADSPVDDGRMGFSHGRHRTGWFVGV